MHPAVTISLFWLAFIFAPMLVRIAGWALLIFTITALVGAAFVVSLVRENFRSWGRLLRSRQ